MSSLLVYRAICREPARRVGVNSIVAESLTVGEYPDDARAHLRMPNGEKPFEQLSGHRRIERLQ